MRASRLEFAGVRKTFGQVQALDGLDLVAAPGEVLVLLGPSGCGKSTALRVAAGVEAPDAGDVRLDARSITHVPAHARGVGLMFQDGALFPHLDVGRNVAYGLRMAGMASPAQHSRVADMLALVGLPGAERRRVDSLSGGEAQRIALARTLAPEPAVALLDEPLASLDRPLRLRLQADLPAILRAAGTTVIVVTHDQEEAFSLADRVAVMAAGKVEQVGTARQVYEAPATEFVARFVGRAAAIAGTIVSVTGGLVKAKTAFGIVSGRAATSFVPGDPCLLDVSPAAGLGRDSTTAVCGAVAAVRFLGATLEVTLAAADERLTVMLPSTTPVEGDHVRLLLAPDAIRVLPAQP